MSYNRRKVEVLRLPSTQSTVRRAEEDTSSGSLKFVEGGETMARNVEEIRSELEQAKRDLAREEAQYGSDRTHPRVGQYYENVMRLERELREAGG